MQNDLTAAAREIADAHTAHEIGGQIEAKLAEGYTAYDREVQVLSRAYQLAPRLGI